MDPIHSSLACQSVPPVVRGQLCLTDFLDYFVFHFLKAKLIEKANRQVRRACDSLFLGNSKKLCSDLRVRKEKNKVQLSPAGTGDSDVEELHAGTLETPVMNRCRHLLCGLIYKSFEYLLSYFPDVWRQVIVKSNPSFVELCIENSFIRFLMTWLFRLWNFLRNSRKSSLRGKGHSMQIYKLHAED